MNREDLLVGMDNRRALFGLFFSFNNRFQTAGDNFYEEISVKQFFVMICLNLFKDHNPTINELSEIMGCTHQNVKQLVNKLEQNELVQVSQDEYDKRKLRVRPTDKMKQLNDKYHNQSLDFMSLFYDGITEEEIAQTFSVLQRIENNLLKYQNKET